MDIVTRVGTLDKALAVLRRRVDALAAEPLSQRQRFTALEALRANAVALTASQRARYCGQPVWGRPGAIRSAFW